MAGGVAALRQPGGPAAVAVAVEDGVGQGAGLGHAGQLEGRVADQRVRPVEHRGDPAVAAAEVRRPQVEMQQRPPGRTQRLRSEEHTSELQSLMRISYAVFCLKKKKKNTNTTDKAD